MKKVYPLETWEMVKKLSINDEKLYETERFGRRYVAYIDHYGQFVVFIVVKDEDGFLQKGESQKEWDFFTKWREADPHILSPY